MCKENQFSGLSFVQVETTVEHVHMHDLLAPYISPLIALLGFEFPQKIFPAKETYSCC